MEIIKTFVHRGDEPEVYFWRTSTGSEVDFIIQVGGRLIPIEVKLSATLQPSMAGSILMFQKDIGTKSESGFVIHPGDSRLPLSPRVMGIPFGAW
jgi:predicted AAA+ superfamily ATPase